MVATLILALALDWSDLEVGARVTFVALVGLAGVMVWRADRARRLGGDPAPRVRATVVDHLGFTLVALFEGFVIVFAINADWPPWAVIAPRGRGAGSGPQRHRADEDCSRSR